MKWEYQLVSIASGAPTSPHLTRLRQLGLEGWEAVAMEHGHVLVKRPIPSITVTFGSGEVAS